MNETINLPSLIKLVAEKAGVQPALARRFMHDLFEIVQKALMEGEQVTIKGIGTFAPGESADNPVLFKPDDKLAASANLPFSMFTPVVLNDGAAEAIQALNPEAALPEPVAQEPVAEPVTEPVPEPEPVVAEEPEPVVEEPVVEETVSEPEPEPAPEPAPAPKAVQSNPLQPIEVPFEKPEPKPEPQPVAQPTPPPFEAAPAPEPQAAVPEEVYTPAPAAAQNTKLWLVLGVLIGIIIGLVGGYFAGKTMARYELPEEETEELLSDSLSIDSIEASIAQSVAAPAVQTAAEAPDTTPTAVADPAPVQSKPVYDTVTRERFLTAIAKEHYGVKNYWIFIYLANPQLKNPNNIPPGTQVLIPAKETFAEATEDETRAKAARLIAQQK